MGRMHLWWATEVIVKILHRFQATIGSGRIKIVWTKRINGDLLTMVWIYDDTERDYSQREDRKNVLVFGDGGDSENPQATPIQSDDGVDLRE
jgi:hypothetical protein